MIPIDLLDQEKEGVHKIRVENDANDSGELEREIGAGVVVEKQPLIPLF